MDLRPYQSDLVGKAMAALREHRSVMLQAATGAGKTSLASEIVRRLYARGRRVVFCIHRRNLAAQTSATFKEFNIPHGYIAAGIPHNRRHVVHVASIDTLRRRLNYVDAPALLIIDEAHMAAAKTWKQVVDHYRAQGSRVLGLSATPDRHDGKALCALFDAIVHGPSVRWLMDKGFLSDYIAYAPSTPDLSGVHIRMGEYHQGELSDAMDRPRLTGDAITHYIRHAAGMRAICYCVSISHSRHVCEQFNATGIPAVHVDGTTPAGDLKTAIEGFASGRYLVLCNVELVTTGFDLSSQVGRDVPIEAIILLRPTRSLALHLQMIGRGLRAKPEPAVILDHAGNLLRLGLPDDEREWSLAPKAKRAKSDAENSAPIRQCEECYHVHRPAPRCPKCGFRYPVREREVEQVDGTLQRISKDTAQLLKEAEEAAFGRLISEGRARGKRNPYAYARQRQKMSRVA